MGGGPLHELEKLENGEEGRKFDLRDKKFDFPWWVLERRTEKGRFSLVSLGKPTVSVSDRSRTPDRDNEGLAHAL